MKFAAAATKHWPTPARGGNGLLPRTGNSPFWREPRNLDERTKAEITEKRQFLACFPWITQFVVGTQVPLLRDARTTVR